MNNYLKFIMFTITIVVVLITFTTIESNAQSVPKFTFAIEESDEPEDVSLTIQILAIMTVLSLAPSILIMMTSFTRIIVVFHFLRQALGTQQMPPNQLLLGLALFLTVFIMTPVWTEVNESALQPYLAKEMNYKEALEKGMEPVRNFMYAQTREKDLALFLNISKAPKPKNIREVPNKVLIPSFIISELRKGFQIGFILYIPLLVLDLVVASVLMSMGMMMLPPVMISLPFKILLFVLVDGWNLVIGSLMAGIKF